MNTSCISCHPNGAVAGYTLANGITHSLTQNARGLPLGNRDAGVLQDQYIDDAKGNVAGMPTSRRACSTAPWGTSRNLSDAGR